MVHTVDIYVATTLREAAETHLSQLCGVLLGSEWRSDCPSTKLLSFQQFSSQRRVLCSYEFHLNGCLAVVLALIPCAPKVGERTE